MTLAVHRGHKFLESSKAVELLRQEINNKLDEAKTAPDQINAAIAHLDKVVANFATQSASAIPEMEEFLDSVVNALHARKQELLWQWRDRAKWEVRCDMLCNLVARSCIHSCGLNAHLSFVLNRSRRRASARRSSR